MKITISARQTNVPEELVPIVEKKLSKLDKFFKDNAEATVKFKRDREKERIELTITAGGCLFRSEESDETYQNALDRATETIVRQIRKNKTRLEKKMRDDSKREFFEEYTAIEEEGDFEIRTKSFEVKPMTPEEAILQMNISGHDFYMFRDFDSDEVCVVYKRRGSGYGLIVPQK